MDNIITDIPAHHQVVMFAIRQLDYMMRNTGFNMKKTFLLLIPKKFEDKFAPMPELGHERLKVITVFDEFALDIFLMARGYESSREKMKLIGYDEDGTELYEGTGEHEPFEEPLVVLQFIQGNPVPKLTCRTPQFITKIEIPEWQE